MLLASRRVRAALSPLCTHTSGSIPSHSAPSGRLVPLQRAMNLSAEQKQALREGYARGLARSAALRHERLALLRRLDVQMLSGHPGTMERVNQVGR